MRKFISLFLVATLICLTFTGCAKKAEPEKKEAETQEVVEEVVEPIKVGLICLHDENSTYDKNFIEAFKLACEVKEVESIIKTNIPESNECYEAAADLVDAGCKIVFADSFGHENFLMQAAKEFPDVQFAHATGTMAHTEEIPNYHNAFASIYEGRYLAGVAAGMKLKEIVEASDGLLVPQVGYIGAFTYAEVISGYTSWFLGVRSIVPEAVMQVQFTGSWYDEALEKEAAQTLINNGCVLISQHADSMGAPTACEEAGVPNVSYNGSTVNACPNTFIISSRINWQPYFEYLVDCVNNEEQIATDWIGTVETGSVELTEINDKVAAEGTADKIEEVKKELAEGKVHVFDTKNFTVNGEEVTTYMADVDTDENYEGDTEVIIDGYFHESEFRSAPYFDLQIDGITALNAMY